MSAAESVQESSGVTGTRLGGGSRRCVVSRGPRADRHRREPVTECSHIAHRKIGFCGLCPTVRWPEEALDWRLLALAQDEAAALVS